MPGHHPQRYQDRTLSKAVHARQSLETEQGKKRDDLTKQQRKDWDTLSSAIHRHDGTKVATSQSLQNAYRRTGNQETRYQDKTLARSVRERQQLETSTGENATTPRTQERKDYRTFTNVIHRSTKAPSSQEVQNAYHRNERRRQPASLSVSLAACSLNDHV